MCPIRKVIYNSSLYWEYCVWMCNNAFLQNSMLALQTFPERNKWQPNLCWWVNRYSEESRARVHLITPTLDQVMYLFCKMAKSGISMQVSTVSSQDRRSITASMRQVLTVLRTAALAFSATVRPILSTSECRREERHPGWWKGEKAVFNNINWKLNLCRVSMFVTDYGGKVEIVCQLGPTF